MRIIFITDYLPYPPISGDSIRVYNLIRRLAENHLVILASLFGGTGDVENVSKLEEFCESVELGHHQWPKPWTILPGLIHYASRGIPLELRLLHSHRFTSALKQIANEKKFDIVHIEHSRMALYLETIPRHYFRGSVLAFQNVAFDQFRKISRVVNNPLRGLRAGMHSKAMRRWEPFYAGRFDRCITVSENDRNLLLEANPKLQVDIIPNGTDVQSYCPLPVEASKLDLLFIGSMGYPPCIDGAIYFCNEILPMIRKEISDVRVWIVGSSPAPEVLRLAGDGVFVTGYVQDVRPYYSQCAACIVPIRAGGGTRLKILEAMAFGRPVISTSIGCEGLEVKDGQHLLIADQADQFAEKTTRILLDPQLNQYITNEARKMVVSKYDWDNIAHKLIELYSGILGQSNLEVSAS